MRLYSTGGRFSYRNLLLSVLLFTVIICLFVFSLQNTSTSARSESRQVTEAAIERALVTCYAVEGMYPASVEYLEEHYGVLLNHSRYVVDYRAAGANLKPYVR